MLYSLSGSCQCLSYTLLFNLSALYVYMCINEQINYDDDAMFQNVAEPKLVIALQSRP